MDLETLDWHEPSARADGHPARDAAGDPLLLARSTARRAGTALGGAPDRRHPRRPAGGAVRPGLLRARATPRTPTAPAVPAGQHRRGDRRARDELLTTVGYQLGDGAADLRARGLDRGHRRAGPVAARPARRSSTTRREVEALARDASTTTAASTSCPPSPACSRRYWRDDARGAIVGLTAYADRGHIARAALEATAWQTREVRRRGERRRRRAVRPSCRSTAA